MFITIASILGEMLPMSVLQARAVGHAFGEFCSFQVLSDGLRGDAGGSRGPLC
jgi:hypothetical protein